MEENNQQNENVQPPVEEKKDNTTEASTNVQTNTSNYNNYSANQAEVSKKKGKGPVIAIVAIIAILIIAIVAGLVYYFTFYTRADQVYKRLVSSSMDTYTKQLEDLDYKTAKVSFKFDADVDIEAIDKDIADLINNIDLGLEVQTDNENKQIIMNLESNYNKKDLLNVQMFSDVKDEKTYLYLKDFLDKYVEIDVDSDSYDTFNKIFDNQKKLAEKKESLQKAMGILKEEVANVIKPEYCSSQEEEITVNEKNVKATKNALKMNQKQLKSEMMTVLKNLKDNEEFVKCFEDKDDATEALEDLIDQCEDIDEDEDAIVEVAIYTTGLIKQELVKFSVAVTSNDETVKIVATKTSDDSMDFEVIEDDEKVFTGKVTVEEENKDNGTIKLKLDIKDLGKVELKMKYSQKLNEDIDKVDVKDSVKMDELTTEDQKKLMTNLQSSELYKLIEKFSGSNLNLSGNQNINNGNVNSIVDNNIVMDNNVIANTNVIDNGNTTVTPSTSKNQIISYDDKNKIEFNLPTGYSTRYTSENYVTLTKGEVSITLRTSYSTKDKYYQDLQNLLNSYTSSYQNVKLSDMESMNVNGRTFYYATFSYDYVSGSYKSSYSTKYMWSEISDKYVVDMQIRGEDDMTADELNTILMMNITENK